MLQPNIHKQTLLVNDESKLNRDFKGIWIPRQIWTAKELSCQEKCLWAEIHSLHDREMGGCYASNQYLSEFCGVKERRLQEMISKMKSLGWLVQVSFDGRTRVLKAIEPQQDKDFPPQGCGKAHLRDAEKCTPGVQKSAPLSYNIDISLDKRIDNTHNPSSENATNVAGVCINEIPLPKEKKRRIIAKKEVSQESKALFPKFIAVIKDFMPNFIVKKEENILISLDEMLSDGRKEEDILRVLRWGIRDNTIRGDWTGWSDKIICANPAAYLCNRFEKIEAASKAKKERKFAACSDDDVAAEMSREASRRAI